jgi:acetoacetyl-CoA synthetase
MDKVPQWFYGTSLNFAENILYSASPSSPSTRSTLHKEDNKVALTEIREGNTEIRDLTWGTVRSRVAHLASAFRAYGVGKGDRVAVVASTSFDTFICFMAITSLGGLFSSSSTDMGTKGILERLVQIKPVYVFVDDSAVYNGKEIALQFKIAEIVAGMKDVKEFKGVVAQPRFPGNPAALEGLQKTVSLERFLEKGDKNADLKFERVAFRDPFLIVYSSGTTGTPKCIVHSVGGVLVNAVKEGKLHRELGPDNVVLQYTTVRPVPYEALLKMH